LDTPSYHMITRHHNPEDHYLNLHRRENLKSRVLYVLLCENIALNYTLYSVVKQKI